MSATPDSTLDDPQQIIADLRRTNGELQRRLDEALAERDEALEQQTATAEVLQVINSSPGDLAPVFDSMLDKALRLCKAAFGVLFTYDGEHLRAVAGRGLPPEYEDVVREPVLPAPGSASLRVVRGEAFVQIADLIEDQGSPQGSATRRALVAGGAR